MSLMQKEKVSLLRLFVERRLTDAVPVCMLISYLNPAGRMKFIVGTVCFYFIHLGRATLWSAPLNADQDHDNLDWQPVVGRYSRRINNTQDKAFSVVVKQNPPVHLASTTHTENTQPSKTFCNPTAQPKCVDRTFGFCLTDYQYPEDEIKEAIQLSEVAEMFSYKRTDYSVDTQLEFDHKHSSCPSFSLSIKPLRIRNVDGHWRVIVQNINDIIQRERVVICASPDEHCHIPEYFGRVHCYTSRCSQQYLLRELLAFDPCNPQRRVFVDTFNLQSGCSCRFSRTPC